MSKQLSLLIAVVMSVSTMAGYAAFPFAENFDGLADTVSVGTLTDWARSGTATGTSVNAEGVGQNVYMATGSAMSNNVGGVGGVVWTEYRMIPVSSHTGTRMAISTS